MDQHKEVYEMGMLMDFYGSLLTESTLQAMDMYFNQDMSLSEIAESLGISRQGAHSFVTKGRQQLLDYEEKLGMYSRFRKLKSRLEDIQAEFEIIDRSDLSKYEADLLDGMYNKIADVISEL